MISDIVDKWIEDDSEGLTSSSDMVGDVLKKIRELNPLRNELYSIADEITFGKLFADTFRNILKYNVTAKTWYFYDGIVWKEDTGEVITGRYAEVLARSLKIYVAEAVGIDATQFETDYEHFVKRLGDRNKRIKMILDARHHTNCKTEDFDRQKDLLNVKNGVINLKTFKLLPHDPELMLSKVCDCDFNPSASSAVWEKFIDEVLEGDQEKKEYIQRLCGYALTADNANEEFYIFYGKTTRNGKSTLLRVIETMMGSYGLSIKPESLALRKADGRTASGDIARLNGCRFLHCSEPQKGMVFDVALLKSITGRDIITARHLYEREFQFVPVFKLFVNSNILPSVNDMTLFSSGRVKVIEFNRHFTEEEQNIHLKEELEQPDNLSGVLNWCLIGLRRYYAEGTKAPSIVRQTTAAYQQNSDKIGSFIDECLERSDIANLTAKEIYDVYRKWCITNGYKTEGKKSFTGQFTGRIPISKTGTVRGKTAFNVVIGYTFTQEANDLMQNYY